MLIVHLRSALLLGALFWVVGLLPQAAFSQLKPGDFVDVFIDADQGLDFPVGLVFGPDDHLYVSSAGTDEVLRYDGSTGAFVDVFVHEGSGGLDHPHQLLIGPGGHLYVVSLNTNEVLRFDMSTGDFIDAFVTAGSGGLSLPISLVFGPDDHLYVSSYATHEVLRYDGATGVFSDAFVVKNRGGLKNPSGITFGPDGHLYVSSRTNEVLRLNGNTGTFIDVFVKGDEEWSPKLPGHLTFGPYGHLYVSNISSVDVRRYNGSTGVFIDQFIPTFRGGLDFPNSIVFADDGNLYISSSDTHQVLRYKAPESDVVKDALSLYRDFILAQNYPNPFGSKTIISYTLPEAATVTLRVFDIHGSLIREIVDSDQIRGQHNIEIEAGDLPSGIYYYRIAAGSFHETKKMVLIR